MKIVALQTGPLGIAEVGTVDWDPDSHQLTQLQPNLVKAHHETASPHHPVKATLVRVVRGEHRVMVPNVAAGGWSEIEVVLRVGDAILFCDFVPEAPPTQKWRFGYAGHCSQPGMEGVELERFTIDEIDLDVLGWKPGLPT